MGLKEISSLVALFIREVNRALDWRHWRKDQACFCYKRWKSVKYACRSEKVRLRVKGQRVLEDCVLK
ncbi:hypothetical protein DWW90_12025 [Parabacteroides sp. AF17-28]|jgi:uncharacterized protein (DUF2237 family)|nr:hypothetical protein DWW90_12025 [Parabacteroides sp. AF17-28]